MLAQALARREQDDARLLHEAAAALPGCLLSLSRQEARRVANEAGSLASGWWSSSDVMLRAAAADIAAAIVRLTSGGEQADTPGGVHANNEDESATSSQGGVGSSNGNGEGEREGVRSANKIGLLLLICFRALALLFVREQSRPRELLL